MISKSGVVIYNPNCDVELSKDLLYHYTTADGLCSILNSMSFKLSLFSPKLDDPVDGEMLSRLYWNLYGNNMKENIKSILSQYRFISMTTDYSEGGIIVKGGENSLMWCMYGEEYKGACIVFKKNKLLNKIRQSGWKTELISVKYNRISPDLKNIPLSNLWNQKKERDKVLCWKEDSWSRQKEKRVLCYSEVPISSLCDITNTIDHVILGYKFTEYENLAKSIYSEDSKAYGMFYSRSFSCVKFAGDFMNDGLFVEFERFLKSNPEFKKKDEEINEKA